jgi:hypothetical protein
MNPDPVVLNKCVGAHLPLEISPLLSRLGAHTRRQWLSPARCPRKRRRSGYVTEPGADRRVRPRQHPEAATAAEPHPESVR